MIPLSDSATPRRNLPLVNYALLAINTLAFLYELSLSERQLDIFIYAYGAIPLEIMTGVDHPPVHGPNPIYLTLITSMFLHGGWLHFGGNMLYLWVFGDNVEDVLGRFRYVMFYFISGLVAAFAQILVEPFSPVPSIGASGAIAGVLGAYLVLYPRAMVHTLVFFGFFARLLPIPAVLIIGIWAITQFFAGVASLGVATMQTGGIAYFAHIGGFVAGVAIILLLGGRRLARRRPWL